MRIRLAGGELVEMGAAWIVIESFGDDWLSVRAQPANDIAASHRKIIFIANQQNHYNQEPHFSFANPEGTGKGMV
jgi:uncharacterized protein (DUF736 family)